MSKITEQTASSNERLLTVYQEIQRHKVQELQEVEQELIATNHDFYTAFEDASSP